MNSLMPRFFVRAFIAVFVFAASTAMLFAGDTKSEIIDGREFYFGVPHCLPRKSGEGVRGISAVQVWIGSKTNNKVTVIAPNVGMNTTFNVPANTVKILPVDDGMMNKISEVVTSKGIYIKSQDPINVTCYVSYMVSGEAFQVIPLESLGKQYYAMSLYVDKTDDYKPGQILVVATKDNTTMTYWPTAETQKGIKPGSFGQVTMRKGETFLIEAKTPTTYIQDWKSDLTGTFIEANNSVAVISGHTKGAFPLYSHTMLGIPADFMRNMMTEMMWPVEMLGTQYVCAPVKYENRPPNGSDQYEKGDLIRFIATEDNTLIYEMRSNGQGLKQISPTLKKGAVFNILEHTAASFFESNKPILAAQYGKAWRLNTVTPKAEGKEDTPMNPSRNGEGMMLTLTPIDHWASYAIFKSPDGMNNFVNITCKTTEIDSITFDGKKLRVKFGAALKPLDGTDFSYVSEKVSAGDHIVEGKGGAKFATYSYGNYDATKDGFAYGYPVGVDFALRMPSDSLELTGEPKCGNVLDGKVRIIHETDTYAGLHSVRMDYSVSSNYTFVTNPDPVEIGSDYAEFVLRVIDPNQDAYALVIAMDRTGKTVRKEYTYTAEKIIADPTLLNFGVLTLNESKDKNLKLTNPTKDQVTIKSLKLKAGLKEFTLPSSGFPMVFAAGETKTISVNAKAFTTEEKIDSVIAELSCYNRPIAELKIASNKPKVYITDALFNQVLLGNEKMLEVEIQNISESGADITISGVEPWNNSLFRTENLLDKFPITLTKDAVHKFKVYYKPTTELGNDNVRVNFLVNTDAVKLYSDWSGQGITPKPEISEYDWTAQRVKTINEEGYLTIVNKGSADIVLDEVALKNGGVVNGNQIFKIIATDPDISTKPVLYKNEGNSVKVMVVFTPQEELTYSDFVVAKLSAVQENYTDSRTIEGNIKGSGFLPKITSQGYTWEPIKKLSQSDKPKSSVIFDLPITNPSKSSFLTVYQIDFVDMTAPDAFAWKGGSPTWLGFPYIDQEKSITLPVEFTGVNKSDNCRVRIISDAKEGPDRTPKDTTYVTLKGSTYLGTVPNLTAVATPFPDLLTCDSKQDFAITLRHTNLVPVTIDALKLSGADASAFTLKTALPIVIPAAADVNNPVEFKVEYSFTPTDKLVNRAYSANVEISAVIDENPLTKNVTLTGAGHFVTIEFYVPAISGEFQPGEKFQAELRIKGQTGEAAIKDFSVTMPFSQQSLKFEGVDKSGSIASAWDFSQTQANNGVLTIKASAGSASAISSDGLVAKLNFGVYLSTENDCPLPLQGAKQSRACVVTNQSGSTVKLAEVCARGLRNILGSSTEYALAQNQPNPATGKTMIEYAVGISGEVRLVLFNAMGEEVKTLASGYREAGVYQVTVDITSMNTGMYYYRLMTGPYTATQKMMITK